MRKEIVPLTSLRGVAAMAVAAMHFSATMQLIASRKFPSLAPHGSLAVDIFFVLSGFIMGYTYLESFRSPATGTAYRKFLGKRAARILPLNAGITIILVIVAFLSSWLSGVNLVHTVKPGQVIFDLPANFLLLTGFGIGNSYNWPTWSISVEFAAYFAFPIFLFFVFNKNRAVFIAACLAALIGLYGCVGPNLGIVGMHNHPWPWHDLLRCSSEFVLGLIVYRIYTSGRATAIFSRDVVALVLVAAVLAIVLLNLPEILAMLLFPPLVLSLSLNNGRVAQVLSLRPLHYLGQISFSIYLVTDPFRDPLQMLVQKFHPAPIPPLMAMALAALFSLLMILPASITYALIERPGRSAVRKAVVEGPDSGPATEASHANS